MLIALVRTSVSWYPNTLRNTALTLTRWGGGRGLRGRGECSSTLVGLSEIRVAHMNASILKDLRRFVKKKQTPKPLLGNY